MNVTSTTRARIETGGDGVVAHVGLHALGRFADALGLGARLSARMVPAGERFPLHDRGKVLVHAMLTLAGGGDACSDVEVLRAQPALFGLVPSDSTLYRTYRQIDALTLAGLWDAMAEVRADVWAAVDDGAPVVLDIDASLIEIHSEHKHGTAPTYKRGFGFHPMFCFADATGKIFKTTNYDFSLTQRARRSLRGCGRVTRPRTTRPITSRSSTPRSGNSPPRSPRDTSPATTLWPCPGR